MELDLTDDATRTQIQTLGVMKPPREVIQALFDLAGDEKLKHVVTDSRPIAGRGTEWEVVAATAQHLIVVHGSSDQDDWSLNHGKAEEPSISGSSWPISDAVRVSITGMQSYYSDWNDGGWMWAAARTVTFRDGETVRLTPFGKIPRKPDHIATADALAKLFR